MMYKGSGGCCCKRLVLFVLFPVAPVANTFD